MIIHTSLDHIPALPNAALTIGTFDGVHLGHQHLFAELKKHGTPVVVTFSNHPAEILHPATVPQPILTLTEKLELFETFGIAMTIVLPFTHDLSQMPHDTFLQKIPHTILIGGEDMRFGARGEGNKTTLPNSLFLPKYQHDGVAISSRLIRTLIQNKQYDLARTYLGHTKGNLWQDSPVES